MTSLLTRGCSPRGHVRETRTVRGRIVKTSKPLVIGRLEITGRHNVLLATIKNRVRPPTGASSHASADSTGISYSDAQ